MVLKNLTFFIEAKDKVYVNIIIFFGWARTDLSPDKLQCHFRRRTQLQNLLV